MPEIDVFEDLLRFFGRVMQPSEEVLSLLQLQVNFDKKAGHCLKIHLLYSYWWKMFYHKKVGPAYEN